MRARLSAIAVAALISAALGACAPGAPATTPVTTPTTTVSPPTFGNVVGLTENRACGGPVSPDACQTPFVPTSDRVHLVPHIAAVDPFTIVSNPDGTFTARLPVGEWVLTAAPISPSGDTACPPVTIDVVAGSTLSATLRCTIELP
jgi:hypothetical protein